MKISEEGKALIKKFEGCPQKDGVCYSYQGSVGVWTCGFGFTKGIDENTKMTMEEVEKRFDEELEEFETYLEKYIEVELTQNQWDAIMAWTWNLGPSNLKSSTMLKEINAKNFARVPSEMRRWNKAGGKTLDGLIRRREAESLLFMNEPWHEIQ